jgi:hypothetical protein
VNRAGAGAATAERIALAQIVEALSAGAESRAKRLLRPRTLVSTIVVAGAFYGGFMGSYACHSVERIRMVAFAAIKVPMLILATTALCLPGFFVFNTVAGLRDAFGRAIRAILGGQAGSALALASLAPVIRFVYASGVDHRWALIVNTGFFTLATIAGQMVLLRLYRPLIAEQPRHVQMLRLWLCLYAFVGTQLGWMLRPFVGAAGIPVTFFRDEPFSNAYVAVAHLFF